MIQPVTIGDFTVQEEGPFFLIAGPCVIESEALTLKVAHFLKEIESPLKSLSFSRRPMTRRTGLPFPPIADPALIRGLRSSGR
jgi:hypothetical protein